MCLKSIRKQINSMNEKEYMLCENDITQFSSHSSGFTVQFSQFLFRMLYRLNHKNVCQKTLNIMSYLSDCVCRRSACSPISSPESTLPLSWETGKRRPQNKCNVGPGDEIAYWPSNLTGRINEVIESKDWALFVVGRKNGAVGWRGFLGGGCGGFCSGQS